MKKIFIDTGAWYALKNLNDPYHQEIRNFFADLKDQTICCTSDYVADEAITLVRMRLKSHQVAAELAQELFAEKAAQMIFVSPVHHKRALEIFNSYNDQDFSYTDCTSFAIMETLKIKEALAFDNHFNFEKLGFQQLCFSG